MKTFFFFIKHRTPTTTRPVSLCSTEVDKNSKIDPYSNNSDTMDKKMWKKKNGVAVFTFLPQVKGYISTVFHATFLLLHPDLCVKHGAYAPFIHEAPADSGGLWGSVYLLPC
ncbi:hypothetical protein GOODEAATRI_033892 [Goodea atripinnis]|uniref:Uncharacterized protein n=1 Tax=Goodea atripinnis TaxID=208336 RepID=A0ABV0MXE0_9TELE